MSSSLESNSDTSTFSPSDTLVRETHSRSEARVCASEGRLRFRPDLNTLIRLKVGWRGPRFLFLASLATSITSSQHLAGNENTPIKPVSVLSDAIDDNLGVSLGLQMKSVRNDCFIMRKKVKGCLELKHSHVVVWDSPIWTQPIHIYMYINERHSLPALYKHCTYMNWYVKFAVLLVSSDWQVRSNLEQKLATRLLHF